MEEKDIKNDTQVNYDEDLSSTSNEGSDFIENQFYMTSADMFKSTSVPDTNFLDLYTKYPDLLSLSNKLYAEDNIDLCISACIKTITLYPRKPDSYSLLALIFEEIGEIEKCYHCLAIVASLRKTDYNLWKRCYLMSKQLKRKEDTLRFIRRICSYHPEMYTRELAWEKFKILNEIDVRKDRVIPALFEMIRFDGYIYKIKEYVQLLKFTSVKRVLRIIYKFILKKRCDEAYFLEFLDVTYLYLEYDIFKDAVDRFFSLEDIKRKIQYVICCENILLRNLSNNKNKINKDNVVDELVIGLDNGNNEKIRKKRKLKNDEKLSNKLNDIEKKDMDCDSDNENLKYNVSNESGEDFSKEYLKIQTSFLEEGKNKNQLNNLTNENAKLVHLDDYDPLLEKTLKKYYSIDDLLNEEVGFFNQIDLIYDLLEVLIKNDHRLDYTRKVLILILPKYNVNLIFSSDIPQEKYSDVIFKNSTYFYTEVQKNKIMYYIGMYYQKMKFIDNSIKILVELYQRDPCNEEVREIIHEQFKKLGNMVLAKEYEASEEYKSLKKITSEEISNMRRKYTEVIDIILNSPDALTQDKYKLFIKQSSFLLKDFFNNTVIFGDYLERNGIADRKRTDYIGNDENLILSKSEKRKINLIYKRFHGLHFEEWFYIIKMNILSCIEIDDYKRAMQIILLTLEASFKDRIMKNYLKYFHGIAGLGLKFALFHDDVCSFIEISKRITLNCQKIICFFSRFFTNYRKERAFDLTQRNVERIILRHFFDEKHLNKYFKEEITRDGEKEWEPRQNKALTKAILKRAKKDRHKIKNYIQDKGYSINDQIKDLHLESDIDSNELENNTVDIADDYDKASTKFDSDTKINKKEVRDFLSSSKTSTKVKSYPDSLSAILKEGGVEILKEHYSKASSDMRILFLSTFFPRNLFKRSVYFIKNVFYSEDASVKEVVLTAALMMNHAHAKRHKDTWVYMEKGFDILFDLERRIKEKMKAKNISISDTEVAKNNLNEESNSNNLKENENLINDLFCTWYNIGRSYHINGAFGWAEIFYKRCLKRKNEFQLFSRFNLSLIYLKTHSVGMYNTFIINS